MAENQKLTRFDTGIDKLNKMLSGGFPEDSVIMLLGPPGIGKSSFCMQAAYRNAVKGTKVLYLTTGASPESVKETMKEFGFNLQQNEKNIIFIDGYSWREGSRKNENAGYVLKNMTNLTEAIVIIKKALSDNDFKNGLVIVDSASDFVMYADKRPLFKFFQILIAEIRENPKTIGLISIEEGMHDLKDVSTITYLADGELQFEFNGENRFFKVNKMAQTHHTLDPINFEINKGKVV
ncbi:MAG: AAA family ATPase [DPANN group archaeon]|nr:AAA family ATPase [DPANN group archaeon]